MAANYVKFRRGTLSDFLQLTHYDDDTLYFITNEETNDIDIYLGSNKITDDVVSEDSGSSGDGTTTFAGNLKDLNDVSIEEEVLKHNDALVYNSVLQKWTQKTIDTEILVIENTEGNTHIDAIDSYFETNSKTPKNGDIAIIKDPFTANDETKYKHTSYIYNGTESHWEAFDGDYTAENIYFDNDFIVTESIGTVVVDKSEGSTTLEASGKNLKELLSGLFAQEKNPTVEQPSAKIEWVANETEYEVGTLFTPSYKLTLNEGSYSFDADTGVTISYYNIKDSKNITNANATEADIIVREINDSFEDFRIEDNTNYYLTAAVDYSDGIIPKTNLGNEYVDGQITNGTIENIMTKTITGYRKCFYGALDVKEDFSSFDTNDIKLLAGSNKVDNRTYSLDIPEGSYRIVFAYPQVTTEDELASVKDVNGLGAEISDSFEKYIIAVGGVDNYSPINYNVFVLDYANPTTKKNTYEIVI